MYKELINRFNLNLESLRSYVESVEDVLKIRKEFLEKNMEGIMLLEYCNIKKGRKSILEIEDRNKFMEFFESKVMKEYKFDGDEISLYFNDINIAKRMAKSINDIKLKKKQTDILYSGTLMLLVVYFEEMINKMLLDDLLKYPRIKIEDTTLKFQEIIDLGSIEEAKRYIVEKEVEKIMKENPNDWVKYLKEKVKLKLDSYDKNVKYFNEIMARRNLIVHNDGIVNNYYLNRVGVDNIYNVGIGDVLKVDSEYIIKAFDIFEEIAISTLFEIYLKEKLDEDSLEEIFELVTTKYLFKEKYYLAGKLYEQLLNSNKVKGELKIYCKLNYWQCNKWQGNSNKLIEELKQEDYSVYKVNIYLGALALQEQYDKFFEVYKQQNLIGIDELSNWPIFKDVRKDKRFEELTKPDEVEEIKELIKTKEVEALEEVKEVETREA